MEEPRFKLISFDKIKRKQTAAYLIKGLIPRTGFVVIWGPPKCGKSFWTFDAVLHVALGREYRGRRVMVGKVVYLALEGQDGFGDRADAFRLRHLEDGPGNVPGFFLIKERTDLVRDHVELIRCIRSQCDGAPSAVVIDTMNRSLVGSESKDEDMAAYIKAADAIREAFDCAVIVIHHCGRDETRPRGHTSLTGAADVQISVKRDRDGNVIAEVEYAKDMPEGAVIASRLELVELGLDQDGDPLTSCVLVPAEVDQKPAAKKAGETKVIRIFRDAFTEALDSHGETIQVRGDQVRAVDTQHLREEFGRRYATGEIDQKKCTATANKAFRRTLNNLPSQFVTEVRDDRELIWRVGPR
ncbi:AAA family ATPase [Bradyrhizobium japonicum]|uniref:AAA family ATPase n=1 Tax=Bradyrhizobium japonicum TaxID=375 RepID=UPI0004B31996|nr:AAA family ATPase [Bradyrhizobium japonicum]